MNTDEERSSEEEEFFAKIWEARKARDYRLALELSERLTQDFPDSPLAWRERAFAHESLHELEKAVEAMSVAITRSPPEPALHFDRGRFLLERDHFEGSAEDFRTVLKLCDQYQHYYYRDAARLFLAESLLHLGSLDEAVREANRVPSKTRLYMRSGLRSPDDVVRDATRHRRDKGSRS